MMARLSRAWTRFWFEPAPAANLGVSRLVLFLALALYYSQQDFSLWGSVSPALRDPIWLFDRFHFPFFSVAGLQIMQTVWIAALVCSAIGLFTHVSLLIAAVLGTYLLGLPHNFGQTYHFDATVVLVFWILAFSRAGDAWSIDALVAASRHPRRAGVAPSAEYRWPVQLALVALSLVFFAAGVAKITRSGLVWITSDHMAILLRRVQYHISDADPLLNWGTWLADIPWAASLLAATAVIVETAYPLALFSRRLRLPLVAGGIVLILGIRTLMGPTFEQFLLVNAFWVPWTAVGAWLRQRLPHAPALTVIYDGACGLCVPTVAVIKRLDLLQRIDYLDATRNWDAVALRFPSLRQDACLTEMHVVTSTGDIVAGFEAYRAMSRVLPLGWLLRPLLYLPPVPALGRAVYRFVAARRTRASCVVPVGPVDGPSRPHVSPTRAS